MYIMKGKKQQSRNINWVIGTTLRLLCDIRADDAGKIGRKHCMALQFFQNLCGKLVKYLCLVSQ